MHSAHDHRFPFPGITVALNIEVSYPQQFPVFEISTSQTEIEYFDVVTVFVFKLSNVLNIHFKVIISICFDYLLNPATKDKILSCCLSTTLQRQDSLGSPLYLISL